MNTTDNMPLTSEYLYSLKEMGDKDVGLIFNERLQKIRQSVIYVAMKGCTGMGEHLYLSEQLKQQKDKVMEILRNNFPGCYISISGDTDWFSINWDPTMITELERLEETTTSSAEKEEISSPQKKD